MHTTIHPIDVKTTHAIRFLTTRLRLSMFAALILLAGMALWLNLTMQSTAYGNGDGRYEDQIDSFSEYVVRNSVIYGVERGDASSATMFLTAGYPQHYDYSSEGIYPYYSNRGAQSNVYTFIALALGHQSADDLSAFFTAARFVNALLVSVIAFVFFGSLLGMTGLAAVAALLFTLLSGIALFSSNLYFQLWTFLLPLAAYPLLLRGHATQYLFAAFVGSVVYFSIRYEFATTFAMLWILPVLIKGTSPSRLGIGAFFASCLGFTLALTSHHIQVAGSLGIGIGDASDLILSSMKLRTMSIEGVPVPFSSGFRWAIMDRYSWSGLSVPFVVIVPKTGFLLFFLLVSLTVREWRDVQILVWAVLTYISWYVFAYQHIMWHAPYDSLLFAVTIQLAMLVVLAIRIGSFLGRSSTQVVPTNRSF